MPDLRSIDAKAKSLQLPVHFHCLLLPSLLTETCIRRCLNMMDDAISACHRPTVVELLPLQHRASAQHSATGNRKLPESPIAEQNLLQIVPLSPKHLVSIC
eukprot:COSAG02_NODE_8385_length_2589_cov_8.057664_3_plen_101_part_00